MQKLTIFLMIILLCLACTKSADPEATSTSQKVESLPGNLFAETKPMDAISITVARSLPAGTKVKVFGEILGSKHPFVDERASFIIGDTDKISVCEDACGAPWDCCCDDKKTIAAATLSVQVLNKKGQVIKTGLKGKGGLKELSKVAIEGEIDSRSTADFMIVNADKIYVE